MLNFHGHKGFCLSRHDHTLEARWLYNLSARYDIPVLRVNERDKCHENYIGVGTVEWCQITLGRVKPDYYPEFMKDHLHRKVWVQNDWILGRKLFVKPNDKHKRFNGFITKGTWSKKKKPPLIWSEVVNFKDEWRYYITAGKVVAAGFYCGSETEPEAPELDVKIPEDFHGTLDMGMIDGDKLALVEAHPPFACGWYGDHKDDLVYYQWIIDGWIHLKNKQFPPHSS